MVAGPNGSGKTTLTDELRRRGVDLGVYINADEFAAAMQEGSADRRALDAQQEALTAVSRCLASRQSLTFETVMSHESKLDLLGSARRSGFRVRLFFVGTSDPLINLSRVAARVHLGGHSVPAKKIRDRYARTMGHLANAIAASDDGAIFDNSSPAPAIGDMIQPMQMVGSFTCKEKRIAWTQRIPSVPDWIDRYALSPLGLRPRSSG